MNDRLKIVHVEDDPLDAELVAVALSESNIFADIVRVDSENDLRLQLERGDLDLVLSDFSLPSFSGIAALKIASQLRPDLPFIFVSGALGEDTAVDMLKDGATDYVLKQRLRRLSPAVTRAVSESRERIRRKQAEALYRQECKRAEEQREALLSSERAARNEAERASRMKDEFLATLSHELRTPLNAILGWAQILSTETPDPEDLSEGLKTIERNARAQTQIIEDLLDMSRIISGSVRLEVQHVSLAPIVRASIDTVKPTADAKAIQVQCVIDPLVGRVMADPHRLQQVLWNLLANAVKFTPRGGRVIVQVQRFDGGMEISVADTGEGIRPEFLPYVFDRFRQADSTTSRRHGGLGLGLAIVKQLVELHGGSVSCVSDGLGKGTTFTICVPRAGVVSETDQVRGQLQHDGRHFRDVAPCNAIKGLKVLVVDDEPDARALVKRLLEDCDAVVTTAGSAMEAVERLQMEHPHVLVSDIGMPGEDGYALIRKIRALEDDIGNIPAVALTAYASADDRNRVIRAGFQRHAAKPVESAELISIVASLAGRVA